MTTSHTPTPWEKVLIPSNGYYAVQKVGQSFDEAMITDTVNDSVAVSEADADLIVHCVNIHDQLIKNLRNLAVQCINRITYGGDIVKTHYECQLCKNSWVKFRRPAHSEVCLLAETNLSDKS